MAAKHFSDLVSNVPKIITGTNGSKYKIIGEVASVCNIIFKKSHEDL